MKMNQLFFSCLTLFLTSQFLLADSPNSSGEEGASIIKENLELSSSFKKRRPCQSNPCKEHATHCPSFKCTPPTSCYCPPFPCCHLGTRGFGTMNPNDRYTVDTVAYPENENVHSIPLLSKNPNAGSSQGGVTTTPFGIRIEQPGNYFIACTVVLENIDQSYDGLFPIFLLRNGFFSATSKDTLGNIVPIQAGQINDTTIVGILENVEANTELALFIVNAGSPQPQTVRVYAWSIQAFNICSERVQTITN